MPEQPELLTVNEVTARFRVSRSTLYRWIADQRLDPVRLGGPGSVLRFRSSDIDALVAPHHREPA